MITALLSLAGCASVIGLFEEAKVEALVDPGTPAAGWRPDARVDLSMPLLDALLAEAVVGTDIASSPIDAGVATIRPDLRISRFALDKSREGNQLVADLRIDGPLTVHTLLGDTVQRVAADARLVATLGVDRRPDGYAIVIHPEGLEHLSFEAEGLYTQALSSELRGLVLAALPAFDVVTLPADHLPIRAVEIDPNPTGVTLRIRTAAPDPGPLPPLGPGPEEGLRIAVSAQSLQQLARREAFLADPLTHDIVAEPTSLRVEPGGDFVLGLRMWRPVGRGWWRTCRIEGSLAVEDGQVRLVTHSVEELDQSPGAAFVDPLMALAEGAVFKGIEKAMTLDLPAKHTEKVGAFKAATRVDTVEVVDGALVATGALDLTRRKGPRDRK